MKTRYIMAAAGIALLMTACDNNPKFKIEGEVYGGEGKTLILAKPDFAGRWTVLDSVKVGKNGDFSLKYEAPASPEIYRLTLGENSIYFPVDSVETVRIETSADKYGSDFKLSGTPQAERLDAFEKEVLKYAASDRKDAEGFKRQVYSKYIMDSQGSILSYYVLTKIVGDKPLFDAADHDDAKYYAAVATQFEQYRPSDPHGKMVRDAALNALKQRNTAQGKRKVISAPELKVLDIELPDEKEQNVKLSDLVGKGKPVVVVFAMMNMEESPAFNRELAQIYQRKGGSVQFYHISFDADQYVWREAARNLPWITVVDPTGAHSNALRDYNVGQLPAFFIYDAGGDLRDRAQTLDELNKKLASY